MIKRLLICYLIICCFFTGSCGITNKNNIVIFVKGSRSMTYVFEKIANEYVKSKRDEELNLPEAIYGLLPSQRKSISIPDFDRSKINFAFIEGGSSRGIASLVDGNRYGELVLSTRSIQPEEIRAIENTNRTYLGNVLYVFKYAEDNIIPIVNKKNPRNTITKEEIQSILQGRKDALQTGKKSWADVYPQTRETEFISEEGLRIDNSIQLALREPASSIYFRIKTEVVSGGIITNDYVEIANDRFILDYVSKIYNSLSFISSIYEPEFANIDVKSLKVMEAERDSYGVINGFHQLANPDAYLRRSCNIIFIKNQEISQEMKKLNITVDDILLDFINFANSKKKNPSDPDKGRDISEKYFSFNFIRN